MFQKLSTDMESIQTKVQIIQDSFRRLAYLRPGMGPDLGEFEFTVVGIHFTNLIVAGSAKDLDNLHQLVHSTLTWEDGLTEQELREHTTRWPDVWNKWKQWEGRGKVRSRLSESKRNNSDEIKRGHEYKVSNVEADQQKWKHFFNFPNQTVKRIIKGQYIQVQIKIPASAVKRLMCECSREDHTFSCQQDNQKENTW